MAIANVTGVYLTRQCMTKSSVSRYTLSLTTITALLALAIWLLLRLVLWADVGIMQVGPVLWLKAFGVGAWFDINTLIFMLAPLLVLSVIVPKAWCKKNWFNTLRWVMLGLFMFGLIFGAVSEFIFWQEFTTRFNFIAVDYLIYTHEVIGNIQESYPVGLIILAIALLALMIVLLTKRYVLLSQTTYSAKQKIVLLVVAIALPLLGFKVSNVDQMEVSHNAYANELAGNGLFSFVAAMYRNELDYDKFYKTIPQALALKTLTSVGTNRKLMSETLSAEKDYKTDKNTKLGPFKRHPKNVILISVESLSAEYLGTYGNKENLTPVLDALAKESLVFDQLFATGTRTVRGLDALTIAIPPIPGQAIVHRPNNEHLATIGELLEVQNFATYFVYGGYGVFDNMNAYFKGNDYKVVDRTDFDKSSIQAENVWGVDDESLFNNAIKILDEDIKAGALSNVGKQKPFFAHIMTTSNHRPFTFPEGKIDIPQGHRAGAVKYTDYAIGQLIAKAKTKPWFKDTLFVIVADHCASVAGKSKLPVAKYHVPLFFYAPDMLPAGHYTRLASQIDIVPTLLDVLGVKGDEHFYGQSMFEAAAEKMPERAFISNYQELGYYKNNLLIELSPKQQAEAFKIDPVTFEATPTQMNTSLLNEAIAYYQTASRAFKHGDLKEYIQK